MVSGLWIHLVATAKFLLHHVPCRTQVPNVVSILFVGSWLGAKCCLVLGSERLGAGVMNLDVELLSGVLLA